MNHRVLAGLILLNVLLVAGITIARANPPAPDGPQAPSEAQVQPHPDLQPRPQQQDVIPPPQRQQAGQQRFVMISGAARFRGPQDVVYIVDMHTSQMIAARFDSRNDQMEFLDARWIQDDF